MPALRSLSSTFFRWRLGALGCHRVARSVQRLWPHMANRKFHSSVLPLPHVVGEFEQFTAQPIKDSRALHPRFYVDEEYGRTELDAIFGRHWFAVAHTAELAHEGDVKLVEVGNTSILLTRDKKGHLNAFYNVCRHRGARVCSSSMKGCKQLVCPYHWWAYRLDGTLKSTPPAATPKARKEELSLVRVPWLKTFAGMVFVNQSPNPMPFTEVLGDLPQKLQRYDLNGLELHGTKNYSIKGNWKLLAENFIDFYHVNAVHPALAKFSRVDDHVPYQGAGQYVGFATAPLTNCGGPGDLHNFNTFNGVTATESNAALFFHIFPNVSVTIYPHSVYTLIMLPSEEPGVCNEQLTLLMAPGAQKTEQDDIIRYRRKCQDLMDFVVNINDEDVVAIENLQRGLQNARSMKVHGEFLPEYDWTIHRFQNMVLQGLRGQPLNDTLMPVLCSNFEKQILSDVK